MRLTVDASVWLATGIRPRLLFISTFIGEETLLDSDRRVAALRGLVLEVHVLDSIPACRTDDRRKLAALAQAAVGTALGRSGIQLPTQQRRQLPTRETAA